jgi:hypothetical protein
MDIGFNPVLTSYASATNWLKDQASKHPRKYNDWHVFIEDLDDNPETHDDIIITDNNYKSRYVS